MPRPYTKDGERRCLLPCVHDNGTFAGACLLPKHHDGPCAAWSQMPGEHTRDPHEWVIPADCPVESIVHFTWTPPPFPSPEAVDAIRHALVWDDAEDGILSPEQAERVRVSGRYSDPTPAIAHAWSDAPLSVEMLADLEHLRERLVAQAEGVLADDLAREVTHAAATVDRIEAKYGDMRDHVFADVRWGSDLVRLAHTPEPASHDVRVDNLDGRSLLWSVSCSTHDQCVRDDLDRCPSCKRTHAEIVAESKALA